MRNSGKFWWYVAMLFAGISLSAAPPNLLLKIPTSSSFTPSGRFGKAVADAGDVNGDGYEDFIVGAPLANRAYVFFGGPAGDDVPDVILLSDTTGDIRLGSSVAGAGDVNRDGYDDVIVGAPLYASRGGVAFIYFGGPSMDGTPDVRLQGETAFGEFGGAVAGIGDVNGDRFEDVLVGDHWYASLVDSIPQAGAAYVFYGGDPMDTQYDFKVTGVDSVEELGVAVASAGDVDGNGSPDFVIGTLNGNRAILYLTGDDLPQPFWPVELQGTPGNFGRSLASGDINGDGYSDVLVGAPSAAGLYGVVHVFYGGPRPVDSHYDVRIFGDTMADYLGSSVTSGDFNGDGFDDILCGSRLDQGNINEVNICFGGASMDTLINDYDVVLQGENEGDYFGYAVANLDWNQDGYDDPLIGAFGYDTNLRATDAGAVYLYNIGNPSHVEERLLYPQGSWRVLPNPGIGVFWITGARTGNQDVTLEVWNLTGTRVLRRNIPASGGRLDLRAYPAGVYFVNVGGQRLRVVKLR